MTEAEWLASADLSLPLSQPRVWTSERKLRLLGCGCCRMCWPLITDEMCRHAVRVGEQYADRESTWQQMKAVHLSARGRTEPANRAAVYNCESGFGVLSVIHIAELIVAAAATKARKPDAAFGIVQRRQAALLRCIAGNPFRPVAFDPSWRSETVTALASAIYAESAFDRLAILADALEEAGCDHAEVLSHCRGSGPHARGCWVVDGVLCKE